LFFDRRRPPSSGGSDNGTSKTPNRREHLLNGGGRRNRFAIGRRPASPDTLRASAPSATVSPEPCLRAAGVSGGGKAQLATGRRPGRREESGCERVRTDSRGQQLDDRRQQNHRGPGRTNWSGGPRFRGWSKTLGSNFSTRRFFASDSRLAGGAGRPRRSPGLRFRPVFSDGGNQ